MSPARKYSGTRVLVTGAAGFIGCSLCAALEAAKAEVFRLDKRGGGKNTVKCDLADAAAVKKVIKSVKPDFVFHLAAMTDRNQDTELLPRMIAVNLLGAYNLFEAARELPRLGSLVAFGTAEEYGPRREPFTEDMGEDPVGPYSFSKICVTNLARLYFNLYRLPVTVLRPTLAYGPGQPPAMFLPALLGALSRGESFPMTPGEQTRDFVYIDDLVEAALLAGVAAKAPGEVFNIGSGKPVTIERAARMAAEFLGRENLLRVGAKPYRKSEIMTYCADVRKAKRLLGWKPRTPFEEGLRLTAESYKDAGN